MYWIVLSISVIMNSVNGLHLFAEGKIRGVPVKVTRQEENSRKKIHPESFIQDWRNDTENYSQVTKMCVHFFFQTKYHTVCISFTLTKITVPRF